MTAVTTQGNADGSKAWVEQQILEANTILESFGNARTVRNNNSSRFGKYVQVLLNNGCQIIGANVINYLLEKSRVVNQSPNERNYHVFYELVTGSSAEEKQRLKLTGKCTDYNYLNQSGCIEIPGVNDKKQFEALKLAMIVMKISREDVECTMKVLSAILHLGNIGFKSDTKSEGVLIEDAAAKESLSVVAELLKLDKERLHGALTVRKISVRGETTVVPLKPEQVFYCI